MAYYSGYQGFAIGWTNSRRMGMRMRMRMRVRMITLSRLRP